MTILMTNRIDRKPASLLATVVVYSLSPPRIANWCILKLPSTDSSLICKQINQEIPTQLRWWYSKRSFIICDRLELKEEEYFPCCHCLPHWLADSASLLILSLSYILPLFFACIILFTSAVYPHCWHDSVSSSIHVLFLLTSTSQLLHCISSCFLLNISLPLSCGDKAFLDLFSFLASLFLFLLCYFKFCLPVLLPICIGTFYLRILSCFSFYFHHSLVMFSLEFSSVESFSLSSIPVIHSIVWTMLTCITKAL